ncbi:MAG: adenosylcobalamin-dependent ribonucleoside-diphosphate reductase [Methanobacteriota archaeon]|nr:MAG: adenosylcobalamin-dependent ribonucleoside-diphosphate reductase [Euryarchaeota archaeon]
MEEVKMDDSRALDVVAREPDPKLSENALRVLQKRYLKKDDTGRVIETPKELFARVAWNLAQAERNYGATEAQIEETARRFFHIISSLEFLPNSPTLMNAGLELQQLSACFAAGTPVSTSLGPKPIEEVVAGDLVLTHTGRYRRVLATSRRESSVNRIKIHRMPAMFASDEHPFLTPDGWVPASELADRYVRLGRPAEGVSKTHIEFEGEVEGDFVYRNKVGRSDISKQRHQQLGTRSLQIKPVKARAQLDETTGWFFGMYLAEGEINPELRSVRFTLGLHEEVYANRLTTILRERFGVGAEITHVIDAPTSWLTVRAHSKILCEWIAAEFSRGFAGKKLPHWIHATPTEFRKGLLQGVADGDGTRVNVNQTRVTMSNEGLVRQLFEVAVGLGQTPCLKSEYVPENATATPWSITLGGKPMYVRDGAYLVESVEPVAGVTTVFNLEVEGDNTYVANGIIVHNCFVLPVDDSLAGIFQTLKESALIHQSGGGTGYSFSRLRPKNDFVKSTMGVASGPVSFMKVYDAATQQVKQGSKRRGANMGILRVDHPDILEFITCKDKTNEITNFNISVAITDKFMESLKSGTKYDLVNPRNNQIAGQLDAREVLDKIAFQAWKNGEPGLFFIDENNRRQPTPHVADMEATNPCGEQPLLPYESCNLGSIDLARHMKRNAVGRWDVDWKKLEGTIRATTRMLDDVIDMNVYPVKQIEEMTYATRKIGLGVMGFARMLFMLEVPYDSKEGVEWGRKIMQFIQETGYNESAKLAEERGVYPAWEGSRHQEKGLRLRNSYVTTVAPTGTLSMIADTSGGCEPEFSLIWYKRVMDGEELPYFLDYFEEVAKREGFWREDLVQKILDNHGSPRGLSEVPDKWQRVFATAHDVSSEWHVRMQAAFQDWCDAAVSKTINMRREATVEDVKKAYLLAFDLHCKGITVYRDGSREDQVLNIGVADAEKPTEVHVEVPSETAVLRPRPRPDVITGRTQKILTGYGALYVTVNEDEKGLFEIFAQIGRGGGYTASFTEGIARLVSLCLRSGVPVDEIIDQLEGIRSPRIAVDHGERVYSIPDAIAKAIKRHIGMQKTGVQPPVETFDELGGAVETDVELERESRDAAELLRKGLNPECPECGKSLVFEEGCVKCHACGYSEC